MKILLSYHIRLGRVISGLDRIRSGIGSSSVRSFRVSGHIRSGRVSGHFGFRVVSGRVVSGIGSFGVELFRIINHIGSECVRRVSRIGSDSATPPKKYFISSLIFTSRERNFNIIIVYKVFWKKYLLNYTSNIENYKDILITNLCPALEILPTLIASLPRTISLSTVQDSSYWVFELLQGEYNNVLLRRGRS
jgi:hypothetical protein